MTVRDPARFAVPAALALLAAIDMLALTLLWPLVVDGNDLVGLMTGSRALLAGADPYDGATWASWPHAVGQRPDTAVFGYPPWVAVAFIPLALLPTRIASVAWAVGGLALATLSLVRLARCWRWPVVPAMVLAAASWPAILVLLQGQWGFVLVALAVGCILALARGRDARAGALWGLMLLVKPQLLVLASGVFAAWAIRERRLRAPLAALAVVAVGALIGTLAAPGWVLPYVRDVLLPRSGRSTQQPTLAGLAGDVAGWLWPLAWLIALVALGLLVALAVHRAPDGLRLPVAFTGLITLSLAAAPYSWSYDHYLATTLAVVTIGVAAHLERRARVAIVLAVALLFGPIAFVLWESAYVRWHDTLAGLVPPLAIVLAYVACAWPRPSVARIAR